MHLPSSGGDERAVHFAFFFSAPLLEEGERAEEQDSLLPKKAADNALLLLLVLSRVARKSGEQERRAAFAKEQSIGLPLPFAFSSRERRGKPSPRDEERALPSAFFCKGRESLVLCLPPLFKRRQTARLSSSLEAACFFSLYIYLSVEQGGGTLYFPNTRVRPS